MKQTMTSAGQDYLKNIYALAGDRRPVRTSILAERLGVSPASVTGMLRKIAASSPALVIYTKHRGVRLTARGRRVALEVIRHHRLLEAWLSHDLGYGWDEVHTEAEKLEHVISEELERRISASLGNPARDPHGDPIPSAALIMPADASIALSKLRPGQEAVVRRVRADDPALLKDLEELGMSIGTHVSALAIARYDQVMRLRLSGKQRAISVGPAITARVYVETTKKAPRAHGGRPS